jgi:hypothetical protein
MTAPNCASFRGPGFGRADVGGDRRRAPSAQSCWGGFRSRQAEYFVPAPSQLPHPRRSRSRRSPRERTRARPTSCVEARPPIAALRYHRSRSLPTNIAVQRRATKTSQTKPAERNFFSICFVLIQPRSVCFSPATDVLPFCRLIQLTRPVRVSNA